MKRLERNENIKIWWLLAATRWWSRILDINLLKLILNSVLFGFSFSFYSRPLFCSLLEQERGMEKKWLEYDGVRPPVHTTATTTKRCVTQSKWLAVYGCIYTLCASAGQPATGHIFMATHTTFVHLSDSEKVFAEACIFVLSFLFPFFPFYIYFNKEHR